MINIIKYQIIIFKGWRGGCLFDKGKKSNYLITRLLSMDYFHYYSKPLLFATYFFPFLAYGKNRGYLISEMDEKMKNIKENKHGNFYNYATQGFGNTPFCEQEVSFDYFYDRLCSYDKEKSRWFELKDIVNQDIEASSVKNDLRCVVNTEILLLKRNHYISKSIKTELLHDIDNYEVKFVLAKILYMVVSKEHKLPDVNYERNCSVRQKLNLNFSLIPNIYVGFRKNLDEKIDVLSQRIKLAKSLQMCFFDGVSIFGDSDVSENTNGDFYKLLQQVLTESKGFLVEIIVSNPMSKIWQDLTKFQINIPHLRCSKKELPLHTLQRVNLIKKKLSFNNLWIKVTDMPLSYSLFIVKFEDESWDYMKVDIYSPFVSENTERPSFYVFRNSDPMLFNHFDVTFEKMWKNDEYSFFIEDGECDDN